MKINTCPFPKGKRQCLIRDTKHSWVSSNFFNSLYFLIRKLGLLNVHLCLFPLGLPSKIAKLLGSAFHTAESKLSPSLYQCHPSLLDSAFSPSDLYPSLKVIWL